MRVKPEICYDKGKEVITLNWLNEYPRPQMRRNSFFCLNGEWTLDEQKVQVPYPPQSKLSGFEGDVKDMLTYVKLFKLPEGFLPEGWRLMLHFGAVDQIADVFFNGRPVIHHEGGYLPFSADVTPCVKPGENELVVAVLDALDHDYPYGKQRKKRGGMWYTPVSGIWQTVWMEAVPEKRVESISITPDLTGVTLNVDSAYDTVEVDIPGVLHRCIPANEDVRLEVKQPHWWTVEDPYLYSLTMTAGEDRVESYFALRTVEMKDNRILLNGEQVFLNGVLDQGYFADGIYLPEDPAEYERDVQRMKSLGFNMLRKHIKLEPEAFYYACDRLGMLVLQDMVNSGPYSFLLDTALPTIGISKLDDTKSRGDKARKEFFQKHMLETQEHLYNHPCVISYTIFNEGWGQFDSDRMYRLAKEKDPTRIYDSTSGWFHQKENDFYSIHTYFGDCVIPEQQRPVFISEFGGYTYGIPAHSYAKYASYGYGGCSSSEELTERIVARYQDLILGNMDKGICGSIYTQLSDVEDEVNGFYTYDRKVCKVDKNKMAALAEQLKHSVV